MSDNADYGAYRIVPCSCVCGGNIAWVRIRPSGAEEMIGCVCHQTPMELIGRTLSPNDGSVTADSGARFAYRSRGHDHYWCAGCTDDCEFGPCCELVTEASPADSGTPVIPDEVKLLRQMTRRAEPLVRAYGESRDAAHLCDEWLAIFETWEMSKGDAS